jgi:hypothetical protein
MSDKKQIKEAQEPINVAKEVKSVLKQEGLSLVKTNELQQTLRAKSEVTSAFNPVMWDQFKAMAQTLIKSGALPADTNAEQVMVKMQAGHEMGMQPFEAIRSLYIVNGMIAIGGRDLIKQLKKHGWKIEYYDESDEKVSARITKGDEQYSDTFTYDEAQKSGWTEAYGKTKPGWKEGANRNLKMRYAVISKIVKSYVPEVMGAATDVSEVIKDIAPLYEEGQVVDEKIKSDDLKKINETETVEELKKVTKELKKIYKMKTLMPAYEDQLANLRGE